MFQAQPYSQAPQPTKPKAPAQGTDGQWRQPKPMNYGQWQQVRQRRGPTQYGGWGPRPGAAPTPPGPAQSPRAPGQYGGINPSANPGPAPGPIKPPTAPTPTAADQLSGVAGGGAASATPQAPAGAPTAAAAPQGVAPQGAAAPWYQQADIDNFQNWATSRYGRRANQQELAQIGANSTNMESAQAYADTLARQQGWQGPAPATPAPESTQPAPFFQAPNQGNVPQLSQELMERILQNPESMSPEVVAQMKARSKQQASSMAEQLRGDARSALAGRGFSGGGGMQAAADAAVDSSFLENLLNTNRDTDIQAATANFNDRLNAAGAADAWQSGNTNRAVQEGGARLQEYLGRSGVDLDNRRFDEARRQFNQTFGFDLIRFLEDTRRNNRDFGEGQRQHNNQVGLGYGNLNMQGQQQLLNWLMASTGGR